MFQGCFKVHVQTSSGAVRARCGVWLWTAAGSSIVFNNQVMERLGLLLLLSSVVEGEVLPLFVAVGSCLRCDCCVALEHPLGWIVRGGQQ